MPEARTGDPGWEPAASSVRLSTTLGMFGLLDRSPKGLSNRVTEQREGGPICVHKLSGSDRLVWTIADLSSEDGHLANMVQRDVLRSLGQGLPRYVRRYRRGGLRLRPRASITRTALVRAEMHLATPCVPVAQGCSLVLGTGRKAAYEARTMTSRGFRE